MTTREPETWMPKASSETCQQRYYRLGIVLLMLLLVGLSGCASRQPARPLQVAVRDGLTGRPVAGAVVRIRSVHLHLPSYPYPKMDSASPFSVEAITDDEGLVELSVSPGQPLQVIVSQAGSSPQFLYLPEHPALRNATSIWMRDRLAGELDPALSSLEIQFRPVVTIHK